MDFKGTRLIFIVIFLLTAAGLATAQTEGPQSEKRDLITKFRAATGSDKVNLSIDITLDNTKKELSALVNDDQELSAAQKQALKDLPTEAYDRLEAGLKGFLNDRGRMEALSEETIFDIYDRAFTVEELRQALAFYTTPTGQKALKFLRTLNAEYEKQHQERMRVVIGDFLTPKIVAEKEAIKKRIAELKAGK